MVLEIIENRVTMQADQPIRGKLTALTTVAGVIEADVARNNNGHCWQIRLEEIRTAARAAAQDPTAEKVSDAEVVLIRAVAVGYIQSYRDKRTTCRLSQRIVSVLQQRMGCHKDERQQAEREATRGVLKTFTQVYLQNRAEMRRRSL